MHARLRGSNNLLTLYQIINKPDFPSLADEIAEPHPDMNIKVAAFTVSEKSSNMFCFLVFCHFPMWCPGSDVVSIVSIHDPCFLTFLNGSRVIVC